MIRCLALSRFVRRFLLFFRIIFDFCATTIDVESPRCAPICMSRGGEIRKVVL